jgi:hypothetical protein
MRYLRPYVSIRQHSQHSQHTLNKSVFNIKDFVHGFVVGSFVSGWVYGTSCLEYAIYYSVMMLILFLLAVVVNCKCGHPPYFRNYNVTPVGICQSRYATYLPFVFPECLYFRSLRHHFVQGKFAARYEVSASGLDHHPRGYFDRK